MIEECKCSDCPYSKVTDSFFTRWCSYWNKVVYLTDGCTRDAD